PEPEATWEPEPTPEPERIEAATPQAYAERQGQEAVRPIFHEPVAAEPGAGRWRLRKRPARPAALRQESVDAPLVQRLKIAAAHAQELEHLVAQLPFLADLAAMADGLISEIDRQFVCAIASVSVRREDGYQVVAHRGLSRVEAGMVIPETQSLFSDVLKTGEGILIQPIDLAQGLVAGIGGARTEAMMVVPALVNDECVAIVVVGGDQFTELDLDHLSDLAAEAAPGLAVAQLLDRLRGTSSD
ncbi:MAG: GAF domain-containing protein, partial [Actinomycetota bacterium]